MTKKKIIIGGVVVVILIGALGSTFSKSDTQQATAQITSQAPTIVPTQPVIPPYKIIHNDNNGSTQNIYVLIDSSENSEATAKVIALDAERKNCTDICNLYVYDDKVALDKEFQYYQDAATFTLAEDQAWQKAHYVFDADHFVGWIEFENPKDMQYYPFKNDVDYKKYSTP